MPARRRSTRTSTATTAAGTAPSEASSSSTRQRRSRSQSRSRTVERAEVVHADDTRDYEQEEEDGIDANEDGKEPEKEDQAPESRPSALAPHIRQRQRAIAEREAARLARPESRPISTLAHADRKKSAVTSTPSGFVSSLSFKKLNVAKGNDNGWCGPFSVARQMIAEREEAARKQREEEEEEEQHPLDEAMEELEREKKRKLHPSISWKSSHMTNGTDNNGSKSNNNNNNKRTKKAPSLYETRKLRATMSGLGGGKLSGSIPSLFDLCIHFLVDNFENVESVGFVDAAIRKRLAHELVARHALDDAALSALTEPGMEALEIIDASGISTTALQTSLQTLLPSGLRYLALDQSGRCFGPKIVQLLVDHYSNDNNSNRSNSNNGDEDENKNTNDDDIHNVSLGGGESATLQALSIGGAYLLKDVDAAKLISTLCRTLQSVEFKACSLISDKFCQSLHHIKPSLQLREVSLEDLAFSDQAWSTLEKVAQEDTSFWNTCLESLRLRRMEGLNDERIELLLAKPRKLQSLDIGLNCHLTDSTLSAIRSCPSCGQLSELRLNSLKELTATGLEALFTPVPNMGPPPTGRLQLLDLGQCDHEAVTDTLIELVVTQQQPQDHQNPTSLPSLPRISASNTTPSTTLSFAPTSIGIPVATSASEAAGPTTATFLVGLAHLNVQGATKVTDNALEILAAHSCGQTLVELNVSYCPNITDQGLGYFVDNCGKQLTKIEIWGMAQVSELFLDGHRRVHDSTLQIIGAWMKKNSVLAIR